MQLEIIHILLINYFLLYYVQALVPESTSWLVFASWQIFHICKHFDLHLTMNFLELKCRSPVKCLLLFLGTILPGRNWNEKREIEHQHRNFQKFSIAEILYTYFIYFIQKQSPNWIKIHLSSMQDLHCPVIKARHNSSLCCKIMHIFICNLFEIL